MDPTVAAASLVASSTRQARLVDEAEAMAECADAAGHLGCASMLRRMATAMGTHALLTATVAEAVLHDRESP